MPADMETVLLDIKTFFTWDHALIYALVMRSHAGVVGLLQKLPPDNQELCNY